MKKTHLIEEHAKYLKAQLAASLIMIVIGVFALMMRDPHDSLAFPFTFLGGGAAWFLITKIRMWWHHG